MLTSCIVDQNPHDGELVFISEDLGAQHPVQLKVYQHLQACLEGTPYYITIRTTFFESQAAQDKFHNKVRKLDHEHEIVLVYYNEKTAWLFTKLFGTQLEETWSSLIIFAKRPVTNLVLNIGVITFDCTVSRPTVHSVLGLTSFSKTCGDCMNELDETPSPICRKCNQKFCKDCHGLVIDKMIASQTNARCPRCNCVRLCYNVKENWFMTMTDDLTDEERKLYDNPVVVTVTE